MNSSTIINKLEAKAGNLSEQRVIIGTIVRKDFRDRLVSLILKKTFRLEL